MDSGPHRPQPWRGLTFIAALCAVILAAGVADSALANDVKGSADVPWVGRYSGSTIVVYEDRAFDAGRFLIRPPASNQLAEDYQILEGRRTKIVYHVTENRSSLEIYRNFAERLKADGFEQVWGCELEKCQPRASRIVQAAFGEPVHNTMSWSSGFYMAPRYVVFRRVTDEAQRMVAMYIGESSGNGTRIAIQAVQAQAMDTDKIVVPTAGQMQQALKSADRIALYGIYFDTGEARIKQESQPTLTQIVELMKADPKLALVVVGHTDSTGDFKGNVTLSEKRAASVVAALTAAGVSASRLTAFGAGMTAPTASNAEESGRARNRRVELVRR